MNAPLRAGHETIDSKRIQALYEENARLRKQNRELLNRLSYAVTFDLSADTLPCFLRKQAE